MDSLGKSVEGFIAIGSDGQVFGGQREYGMLVMRNASLLKRVARPDARVVPVTVMIHDTQTESLVKQVLGEKSAP